MKKLLASVLCLALAASVVLSSCDDKKDEKKKNKNKFIYKIEEMF